MKIKVILFCCILCFGCSKTKPRKPINPKPSTTLFSKTIEVTKSLNEIENQKIMTYLKKDSLHNYIASSNGFWYRYINKVDKNLPTPKTGNNIVFEYNIKQLNDSIIYSKKELGLQNYKVDKEDFITAIQKGIKLMKVGETITFIIPSYSAYGITGDGHKIRTNQTIKSTVTLIQIK